MITNKTHGSSVVRIQMTISKSANVENVISHVNELGIALAKEPSWQTVFIEPLSFKSIHSFDENGVHAIFSANVKADKFSMASSECKMRLINLIKRQKMQVIVVG
jgi:small-conductance mechanosensitive channel